MGGDIRIIDSDPVIERELARVAPQIGKDFEPYRGHVYRVMTYAMHFLGQEERWRETIAFALAYHDVGMWTDDELAYLEPSEAVAERMRQAHAPHLDGQLVRDIIHWHHKVTAFDGPQAEVVNAVRKADWIDASNDVLKKGLSKAQVAAVNRAIPKRNFSGVLMRLAKDLNHGNRLGGLMRVLGHVYKV